MPRLQFWYDFASPYSYLSATRVDRLAEQAGVNVDWRPFLLGPIFMAQGWPTSPFNIYPAKGRYMVRDLERIAAERGLRFQMPATFPAASLAAARLALVGEADGWTARFSRAVFEAEFARGQDIASPDVLAGLLSGFGIDAEKAIDQAGLPSNKDRLRQRTSEAMRLGLFGAPSFVTRDGEVFWGDDRLEQALMWAAPR